MATKHIKWTTLPTVHVDLDTGQQLTKYETRKYKLIKTEKSGKIKPIDLNRPNDGSKGEIQWTKCYRKSEQGNLFE